MKDLNKIIRILKENEVNIIDKQKTNGNDFIITSENMLFLYEPECDRFSVSFHVGTRPDKATKIYQVLSEDLSEVIPFLNIMDSYHMDLNNNLLYGDAALTRFYNEFREQIVKKFIKDQMDNALLESDFGFHS